MARSWAKRAWFTTRTFAFIARSFAWVYPQFASAWALRILVERRDDLESFGTETLILYKGAPEVAHADQHDRLQPVGAEMGGDHPGQLVDVVAQSAGPELPQIGKVLAQLCRLHAGGARKRLAADGGDMVGLQPLEAAEVQREAIDGLPWDVGLGRFLQRGAKVGNRPVAASVVRHCCC
jgi:hypothetical protein